jgi:hypothetical protein
MSSKLFIASLLPLGLSFIFLGKVFAYQEQLAYSKCMARGNSYNYCKVLIWGR